MSFTHLQVRSGYSLMESTITIDQLVKKASDLQFQSLALTDEHVLYGAIKFYRMCLTYGIKPIIGMIITVINGNQREESCILLAKNNTGYKNLMRLSTLLNIEDQSGIQFKQLVDFTDHLICILPINNDKLFQLLSEKRLESILKYLSRWKSLFQEGDFYIGVQDDYIVNDSAVSQTLQTLYNSYHIPVVAINDVRYLHERDFLAYDCLQAMKYGKRWTPSSLTSKTDKRYFRSQQDMSSYFKETLPYAILATEEIAQKCNISLENNELMLPAYPVPHHLDAHSYLKQLCWSAVYKKYHDVTEKIKQRLQYELNVIASMGFSDYFLIVCDFVSYAKRQNIFVGPGRGSAAGSLVAYLLEITNVDPIKYDLLFERFLNPERTSMPDIDIDFSDRRRDEVIDYVQKKYGKQHVAQIVTFGTFAARSLLRELFKTMGVEKNDASFILNYIPVQSKESIQDILQSSDRLASYVKQSKKLRVLFHVAMILEGLPRHISTHAAGVVISGKNLLANVPLTISAGHVHMTQYDMDDLEWIGLLKFDFLGLRNLTLIERIIQSIQQLENDQTIDIDTPIPENEQKTFQLLQSGKTDGIFQLESQGMKQVLTKLKPTTLEDIIAINALYRPGPMRYIPTYIQRKLKKQKISYPHEDLKPILKQTYGVLIYQEQIMQIAHQLAGFTLGEADLLRRAVSKKNRQELAKQREIFIQGCLNNGYSKDVAKQLFLWIVKFSNYGFNRSHAVAYSKISYRLAYLKAHYPTHFYAELLSSVTNQREKIHRYIKEASTLNISLLPPHINKSFGKYTVESSSIRMGLLAIKGVGYQTVKEIIRARRDVPFKSLFDFCLRISLHIVDRKTIEKLIMVGSFDELHNNRGSLLASLDQAIEQGQLFREFHEERDLLKGDLQLTTTYTKVNDFSQMRKLADEKELLGTYVSSHPLKEYRSWLKRQGYVSLGDVSDQEGGRHLKSVVIVQAVKGIRTRRGDSMAFLIISDELEDMEAVVFPHVYRRTKHWLQEEMIITIEGRVENRNGRMQLILNHIKPFEQSRIQATKQRLFIKVTNETKTLALSMIEKTAQQHPRDVPIYIFYEENETTYKLAKKYNIYPESSCMQKLYKSFGKKNVVLTV